MTTKTILVLDTATEACSVALSHQGKPLTWQNLALEHTLNVYYP